MPACSTGRTHVSMQNRAVNNADISQRIHAFPFFERRIPQPFSEMYWRFRSIINNSGGVPQPRLRMPRSPTVCTFDFDKRTCFTHTQISIWAWPSLGGVIILDQALPPDFEFLSLDLLSPPLLRSKDQEAEDEFCQQLLLLGAKWWDSVARYEILCARYRNERRACNNAFIVSQQPPATTREGRCVKVGWPSTGGLWIAECPFETHPSRLQMARTMDERCEILRDHFEATFYRSIDEYEGHTFIKSWERNHPSRKHKVRKHSGEAGPLLQPDETCTLWKEGIKFVAGHRDQIGGHLHR